MAFQVDNPLWLLGLVPMIVVLYLYWRTNNLLSFGRKIVLIITRMLVFTIVIAALAGVQIRWPVQKMTTAFVIDRSHSMAEHEQLLIEQVNEAISQKAIDDKTGIISTAAEAAVEMPLSDKVDGIQSFQTIINRSYTNLGSGLQLAGSLFSSGDKGRVVLLTDGNENIGDAVRQASYLDRQGYLVDVLPFSSIYQDDVALTAFDVPETIYLGEQADLSLTVDSSIDTASQIRIIQDGETIIDQTIQINQGENQFGFKQLVSTDGFHTFRAEIVSEGDQVIENNQLSAFAETTGIPRVLLVEGEEGIAANLEKALDASAVQVEKISPALLPGKLSSYLAYDSIVFSNVSAHMMSLEQMDLIETAVKDFGVGFIMTGGNQSFGVGGYFKTPIEALMPVDMEVKGKKELPSLGLAIVLDKSGSMMGNKIALAKEAAARSVELLRESDTLGVIAFDSVPWQIVELGPIDDKEEVLKKIRSITASGGTDIFTPTAQAYDQMKPLELKRKHIILLTDGESAASMNYQQMIEEARENGITLSTVAIGIEADARLLEEMAELGGGRFYQVQNDSSIPTILSRETALVTRTYIEDNPFFPKLVNGLEWGPYFKEGVPEMNAYIATTPKGRAQQILVSEKDDPVLTRWQYGLGKTVAWTSDLSGEWAGKWPQWESWSPLWNDIVTWTLPQYQKQNYQINKEIEGNQVTLQVTSASNEPATLDVSLVSESGEEVELDLQPKAPGEYQGTFEANESGVYFLQITEQQGEKTISSFKTGVVIPYSEEYTFKPMNEPLIEEIAKAGGGQVISDLNDVFLSDSVPAKYDIQDLFYLLLTVALFLFMIDVAVRRFRFRFTFISNWRSGMKVKQAELAQSTDKRSTQLSQLKKASTKNKQKTTSEKQPETIRNEKPIINRKPVKDDKTKQSTSTETREERIARLLDATNRRSK